MHFVNGIADRNKLYEMEHLWHWWNRWIEFSYHRTYLVPSVSSKHHPKVRITLKLGGLTISYRRGSAPWEE